MADSYFVALDEGADTGRYLASPHTAGPWADHLQHGGPPNALAVVCAQRALEAQTGRDDFVALRLAADFVGPVPVAEIETRARVVRAARTAALVEVVVSGGGRDCLLVRTWFVRDADTSMVGESLPEPVAVPETGAGLDHTFGYGASLEWRFVHGRMDTPGPARAWIRPTMALIDGSQLPELSGLALVALVADSSSGISAELDWTVWSFLNVDLDIHLARPFLGEWVFMDSRTQLGAHGSALARSVLSDVHGVAGSGLQTLVLAQVANGRPTAPPQDAAAH